MHALESLANVGGNQSPADLCDRRGFGSVRRRDLPATPDYAPGSGFDRQMPGSCTLARMTHQPSQHAQLLHSLALVHRALRRSLDSIIHVSEQPVPERDRGDFADFIERFTKFLHSHHDGEEQVIFPSLRAAAERVSTRALLAHLDSWQAAHETRSPACNSSKRPAGRFEQTGRKRRWCALHRR